ncbi:uncharacterized protein [Apostichopus japonicus]|uniref:uncharacterized protein n=1 Tax=Stichopus japonicus TaxID=307972 RepID=UPI003AB5A882
MKMMTLKELEETVDEVEENLRQQDDGRQENFRNLHSTQSITGRQSLLTHEHVQYLSASDALSAYIDSFEDTHPLQTSLYQRTVEGLLLPKSVLSRTVNRSLETGKGNTKEELHLYHMRQIIDDSFNEILQKDKQRHDAEDSIAESEILARAAVSSDVSSLPDPSSIIGAADLTPLLKSTPLTQKPSGKVPLNHSAQETTDQNEQKIQMLSSYSPREKRISRNGAKYNLYPFKKNTVSDPVKLGSSISSNRGVMAARTETALNLNSSLVSGGRPPPSWVDDLDNSNLTGTSVKKIGSLHMHEGFNHIDSRRKTEHLGDTASVSSYGIDEMAVLRDAEKIIEERKRDRMRKQAERMQMKRRWLDDRRNESMMVKLPTGRRSPPKRTESVTTEDLLRASPYGLETQQKSVNLDNHKLKDTGDLFSSRERTLKQKSWSPWKQTSLELNSARNALSRGQISPLSGYRKASQSSRLRHPFDFSKRKNFRKYSEIPATRSPTGTESLLHASPLGRLGCNYSRNDVTWSSSPDSNRHGNRFLNNSYSDGGVTIGSIGDTSRVDAVVQRANRLMDCNQGGTDVLLPDRKVITAKSQSSSSSPDSIINRYLGDCLHTSKEMSDNIRPLESLKQILYTLQDLEETQEGLTTQTDEGTHPEWDETDKLQQIKEGPFPTYESSSASTNREDDAGQEPGAHSLKRAMAHLSRLKLLINEEEKLGSVSLQESVM